MQAGTLYLGWGSSLLKGKFLCVPQDLIVDILGSAGQGNVHYVNLEDIEKKEENRIFIKALQRWGVD